MSTKIYLQFLITEEKLSKEKTELLKRTINKHAKKAGLILNITLINITVYPNSKFVILETGEGGYAPSKDWLHIYIDATRKRPELDKIIKNIIPATIYHEMNHVARWKYAEYGSALLDVIIAEGLATVFAEEQWKKFRAPWTIFSKKELNSLLDIIRKRKKIDDVNYNHEEWFYGTGKLPRWIGYKVGHYVVKSFRDKNKNMQWSEIMRMSTNEIIKLSGVNLG